MFRLQYWRRHTGYTFSLCDKDALIDRVPMDLISNVRLPEALSCGTCHAAVSQGEGRGFHPCS